MIWARTEQGRGPSATARFHLSDKFFAAINSSSTTTYFLFFITALRYNGFSFDATRAIIGNSVETETVILSTPRPPTFVLHTAHTNGFYSGLNACPRNGEKVAELTADPENGQCPCFGEQALLKDEPRNATITVCSNSAAVLVLDRATFESILGPLR